MQLYKKGDPSQSMLRSSRTLGEEGREETVLKLLSRKCSFLLWELHSLLHIQIWLCRVGHNIVLPIKICSHMKA